MWDLKELKCKEYAYTFCPRSINIFFSQTASGPNCGGRKKKTSREKIHVWCIFFFYTISRSKAERGKIKEIWFCAYSSQLKNLSMKSLCFLMANLAGRNTHSLDWGKLTLSTHPSLIRWVIYSPHWHRWPHPPLHLSCSTELTPTSLDCWVGTIPLPM